MNRSIRYLLVMACWLATAQATAAQAGSFTNGTYTTPDGYYSVTVTLAADGILTVVEPNKTSPYTPAGNGDYHFTNPNNGVTYGMRIIDPRTIDAFKPGSGQPATRLTLASAAATTVDVEGNYDEHEATFDKYADMAQKDGDNAHVWAACGAAALARATLTDAGFREYAPQVVASLKPIMVNDASTPCDDAIPDDVWQSVR